MYAYKLMHSFDWRVCHAPGAGHLELTSTIALVPSRGCRSRLHCVLLSHHSKHTTLGFDPTLNWLAIAEYQLLFKRLLHASRRKRTIVHAEENVMHRVLLHLLQMLWYL